MKGFLNLVEYRKILIVTLILGLLAAPLPTGATNSEEEGWRLLKEYVTQEEDGLEADLESSYRVNQGDTLWTIARRYGVEVSQLMAVNGLTNPKALQPDQTLSIPESLAGGQDSLVEPKSQASSDSSRYTLAMGMQWPVVGGITSPFGNRGNEFHHGLDIAANTGDDIRAALGGKVTFSGWRVIYGRTIIIDHGNGVRTVYGHASRLLVKTGDQVEAGQVIGKVGASGNATGPHLHFELHVKDQVENTIAQSNVV